VPEADLPSFRLALSAFPRLSYPFLTSLRGLFFPFAPPAVNSPFWGVILRMGEGCESGVKA